jgi:hypothetical protein
MTWPISCTSRSRTKPSANFQPQISEYAATETSIDADVVNSFSFGSSRASALSLAANFTARIPTAASAPPARFHHDGGSVGSGV